MNCDFEAFKMHIEFLPFFYEIENVNVEILKCVKKSKTWFDRQENMFLQSKRAPLPEINVPNEVEKAFHALKKILLDPNISVKELEAKDGYFQKTLDKLKSLSFAEPFHIPPNKTAKHLAEIEAFYAAFYSQINKLCYLITLRKLITDMGRIQRGNHDAVDYWQDKKTRWVNELHLHEQRYFDALKSLPLALSREEEMHLLDILNNPAGPYYNDGNREAHKAAQNEVQAFFARRTPECMEFPFASVEAVFTPNGDDAVTFRLPVYFSRRKILYLGGDAEPLQKPLHLLFDTLLCQFMRNTTAGEMEITVVDPIFNGDFMTKFQRHFSGEKKHAKTPARLVVNASRDINSLKAFLKDYLEENITRTIQLLGDEYEYIEDFNQDNPTLPIPRRMLLINGLDSFIKPDSINSSQDLQNLSFILKNAAKCGVFVVLAGREECFHELRKDSALAEIIRHMALDPNDLGAMSTSIGKIVHFGHPGFEITSDLRVMETPLEEIRRLCKGLQEITASIDLAVNLSEILPEESLFSIAAYNRLNVPFGKNARGEIVRWFCDKEIAGHTLIIGGTGSGKSNLLHALITSACYLHSPDVFQVFLIDLKKGVEFKRYADAKLPHARVVAIEGDAETAVGILEGVYRLYEKHTELLTKYGVSNLEALWERGGRAPRIAVIIDEFQILFEDERTKMDATRFLEKLIKEGRAAGFNVILATQNPANVPSAIKDNVTTRIVMKNKREIFTEVAGFQNKDFCNQVVSAGEFLLLDSGMPVLGRAVLVQEDYQERLMQKIVDAAKDIKLDFKTLVFNGQIFPPGDNHLFRKMLTMAASQRDATFVLGENKTLNGCVYCTLSAEPGENMLIAGNHAGQRDLNDFLNENDGECNDEVQCSTAVYWTLAQSLNPMVANGRTEFAIYDPMHYLVPHLTCVSSCKTLTSAKALANEIFALCSLVQEREAGADASKRKMLAILNAHTLNQLKEQRNETSALPSPAAIQPKSGSLLSALSAPPRVPSSPVVAPPFARGGISPNQSASAALQYLLQYGPPNNVHVIMSSSNLGILLRDVMERMSNLKNYYHHIICMQMSEDDLSNQLGIRKLRIADLDKKHAFYIDEIRSPLPQRFRPFYEGNINP